MIEDDRVTARHGVTLAVNDSFFHEDVFVDGKPLDPPPGSVLMMHKPVGYVCSTKGSAPLIYDLLPERFRHRSPVMSPVGRLDMETSGLLLLTDDGQINHRITSPRTHLRKVYQATLANDLLGSEIDLFASGTLVLESEDEPLEPAKLEVIDHRRIRLTLTEGRYHQVRRMLVAVGNHVETLIRTAVGGLELGDLPSGEWRQLTDDDMSQLFM